MKDLFVITGASTGLGLALAEVLVADASHSVVALSRRPCAAPGVVWQEVDLADPAAVEPAFNAALARVDRQHRRAVLINNAGMVDPVGRFDHFDATTLPVNVNLNLVAPMLLTRLFTRATSGTAESRLVVNISSGAAKRPIAGWSAYCAAKAGLEMATRVAAAEAGAGLAVCSLAPGVIDTPMQALVRSASASEFPDVARFQAMKAEGVLRAPLDVARDIVGLIDSGRLTNGGNFDIRELLNRT